MLFMVIERFKNGDPALVGERFRHHGRMLPAGVEYVVSWMEVGGTQCYQLMEARDRKALDEWMNRWKDLVDFDVVAVVPSTEFWATGSANSKPA